MGSEEEESWNKVAGVGRRGSILGHRGREGRDHQGEGEGGQGAGLVSGRP